MTELRISTAAAVTGIPATTLRYWEQAGLICSTRTASGYRIYDERAVERLRFISAARRLELPLEAIRDLLASWDGDTCRSVKQRLRPMVTDRLARAEAGMADMSLLAQTLRAGLARLDALPDRDTPCDPECSFLEDGSGPGDASIMRPAGRDGTVDDAPRVGDHDDPAVVLACSLTGTDRGAQIERWRELLTGAAVDRAGLAARVELDAEQVVFVAALVRDEQQCCPFLAFRLDFHGRTVVLTISAPSPEALPFLEALLEPADGSAADTGDACCSTCTGAVR